ncbi:MAG: response regulator [Proteobacteria bacterium]|nr:response regulator [Pseudomonadota bacterium]
MFLKKFFYQALINVLFIESKKVSFSFFLPENVSKKDILSPHHLLVVDDDMRLRDLLFKYLQENDFVVAQAQNAEEALNLLDQIKFDLIVLDIMMPGQTGLELCDHLRDLNNTVPILFLSAQGEVNHRLEGFEKGGDDFLPKPFEPKELLLRIHSILRRGRPLVQKEINISSPKRLMFGEFLFDLETLQLTENKKRIPLTEVERKILRCLMETPKECHTRESIAQKVSLGASARSIDVQIVRLRRKIEKDPKFPRYLQTIRHKGYVFIP